MIDSGDEPRAGLHLFQAVVGQKSIGWCPCQGKIWGWHPGTAARTRQGLSQTRCHVTLTAHDLSGAPGRRFFGGCPTGSVGAFGPTPLLVAWAERGPHPVGGPAHALGTLPF